MTRATRAGVRPAGPRAASPAKVRPDVPARRVARVRAIARRLPEVGEEPAWVGTRWTIRGRTIAHVVHVEGGWPPASARAFASAGPIDVLTVRGDAMQVDALRGDDRYVLPAWGTRWGSKVIGVVLDAATDWAAVAMLIGASYRLLAPRALAAQVTTAPTTPQRAATAPRRKAAARAAVRTRRASRAR